MQRRRILQATAPPGRIYLAKLKSVNSQPGLLTLLGFVYESIATKQKRWPRCFQASTTGTEGHAACTHPIPYDSNLLLLWFGHQVYHAPTSRKWSMLESSHFFPSEVPMRLRRSIVVKLEPNLVRSSNSGTVS